MFTDNQIDELIQPIINLYSKMEYDLIIEIAKRFANYDNIAGSLEWQLHKLDELGGLNKTAIKIISAYAKKSEAEVEKILKQAGFVNVDFETLSEAYRNNQLSINPLKMLESPAIAATLENSYRELNETFRLIRTKALESTKQAYMNIINTSYLEVASGMYDYQTSIKRGIQKMAANGIDGATYRRSGKIVKYSIEATVRRDTLTAVHQTANKVALQSCKEMNCDYVEISQHLGARVHPTNPIANHAGWQGKVFKIEGKAKGYPNLKESTGYPDDILGLGGVNCRHRMFPFFPGISVVNPIKYDENENRKRYEATQHQHKLERDIRKLKKQQAAAKEIDDKDTVKLLQHKLDSKYKEINNFCEQNGLKRDYSRELVTEQVYKKNVANSNSKYYNDINSLHYPITDKSITSLEKVKINGLSVEQSKIAFKQRVRLLKAMKNRKVGDEGSVSFDLNNFEVSPINFGTNGETKIYKSVNPYYAIHNHPDNGVLSPKDLQIFLNKDLSENCIIGLESVGNNGTSISAITRTQNSDTLGYMNYISNELDKYITNNPNYRTYSFDELDKFSKKILLKGTDYGFKITII